MITPVSNTVALTGDPRIDGLTQGAAWVFSGAPVLTYALDAGLPPDEGGPGASWAQGGYAEAFVRALATWSDVADIGFEQLPAAASTFESAAAISATLIGHELLPAVGAGIIPDPLLAELILLEGGATREEYPQPEGDVFFDVDYWGYGYLYAGGFGLAAMIHEIGHALGLKHTTDDGANARPTFAELGVPQFDSKDWTVMSSAGQPTDPVAGHAATPMLLDILAIQHIYGPNLAYHAGDDVYDLALSADHARRAIWDAGGSDTFDASQLAFGVVLDLRPGAGVAQAAAGLSVAIAYNVTIENAIGSAFPDVLTGNAAANRIEGGGGDDTLDGGAGADTAVYRGSRASYAIGPAASGYRVTGAEGNDTLTGIERVSFSDGQVAFDLAAGASAGETVRIIGAAFGASTIGQHPDYVSVGLALFDGGMSVEEACALVLATPHYLALAGSTSNEAFVTTVYTNVAGTAPSPQEHAAYLALLQGAHATMTQAQLLEFAAHHPANEESIDLVGLLQTGLAFV